MSTHLAQMKQNHLPQHQHTMRRGPREFSEGDTMFHGHTLCRRRRFATESGERKDDDHVPSGLLDALGGHWRKPHVEGLSPGSDNVGAGRANFIRAYYIYKLRTRGVVLHKFLVCASLKWAVGMLIMRKKPQGWSDRCGANLEPPQICVLTLIGLSSRKLSTDSRATISEAETTFDARPTKRRRLVS
jgi:hypothetical protein